MTRSWQTVLAAAALAATPVMVPAFAQTAPPAEALEEDFAAFLDRLAVPSGSVEVLRADDGTAELALRDIRIPVDGDRLILGDIDVSLAGLDGDAVAFEARLAAPEVRIAARRGGDAVIRFEAHVLRGVWSRPLQTVLDLDLRLTGMTAGPERGAAGLQAGTLALTVASELVAPGRWDRLIALSAADLTALERRGEVASAGRLDVRLVGTGLDLAGYAAVRETLGLVPHGELPDADSPEAGLELLTEMIGDLVDLPGTWGAAVEAEGVRVEGRDGAELDALRAELRVEPRDDGPADLVWEQSVRGFRPARLDLPPAAHGLVLGDFDAEVAIERLPVADAVRALYTSLAGGVGDAETRGGLFGIKALLLLARQDIALAVRHLRFDAPELGIDLTGRARVNPLAALAAEARFELVVRGMEQIVAAAARRGDMPADQIAGFTMIQAMGERLADRDGQSVHRYVLELAADGGMRVNDSDIRPLIEAAIDEAR